MQITFLDIFIQTEASIPPKKFKVFQLYNFLSPMSLLHQQSQDNKGGGST